MNRFKLLLLSVLLLNTLALGQESENRVSNYIAIMDITCGEGVKNSLSAPLTNIVIEELVKVGKFTVIDRANRDKILSEVGFQQTGCVDESCAVEMGRVLGVGKLVIGNIDLVGKTYLINLQLINVETAAVETATSQTCKCKSDGLIEAVRIASKKLMGGKGGPMAPSGAPEGFERLSDSPFCMMPPTGWAPMEPSGKIIAGYLIATEKYNAQISIIKIPVGQKVEVQAMHNSYLSNMKKEFKKVKILNDSIIERNGLVMGEAEFTGKKKRDPFHFFVLTIMEGTDAYFISASTPGKDEYIPVIQKALASLKKCDD